MWAGHQRYLECIQDPPDMNMYRVACTTTINHVDVPYYKCLRGSNSLEGFHKALQNIIPDRSLDAVFGGKGWHHKIYSAPLIDRLNTRCRQLFGETVEENFRAPADVPSNELLGLEYLFSQSTGESGPFSLQDIVNDGPGPEEVVQPGQPDPDEAYQSDVEAHEDVLDAVLPHITLTSDETSTVHPSAFVSSWSRNSPEKSTILKAYERIQHRILVEDLVPCKAGIPLQKINVKTVRDFIHHQERFLNLHATKQPSTITKTTSIPSADLPPAPHQPAVLPPPDYPLMEYMPTPSTAGTKVLKGRTDIMTPLSGLNHHCHLCYCHRQ
ncbi:hypothetical protein SKAU_G00103290 [Synaphobranchus kaupii]|uniref:Uncharacterized protein n=1 Tax=Synaphobranchus kaupii TaxID=118154 RepID=A0A9Q1FZ04_SYNKA|nr:hypothetical protein SKAU_G00103290 [Synaphobranchus kaupii]